MAGADTTDRSPLTITVWRSFRAYPEDIGHAVQVLRDRFAMQLEWPPIDGSYFVFTIEEVLTMSTEDSQVD